MAFTDKYLKRSFKTLQHFLDPDTVYFLGDLFDGGREWATLKQGFKASEEQWKQYGQDFWLKEFNRFGHIFFDLDQVNGGVYDTKDRSVIASLPGNHDLGFGAGVQKNVRDRFEAYFGKGNRVDVIGNHTFIGMDTVSLSAMDYPDVSEEIWRPGMDFLNGVDKTAARAVEHELLHRQGMMAKGKHTHTVVGAADAPKFRPREVAQTDTVSLPTVLLTHVPFYREPGTPCGPLRERHPPSAPNLEVDEPNAIRVAAGYQYQNVLTKSLSKTIAEKIGKIGYIFSGDDHDYCELTHRAYPSAGGGIKEITVKSMSWAMGVRKPGFLLASLWHPVDDDGNSLDSNEDATMQTHLCILPDQLGVFIRYAVCLVLTLGIVLIKAVISAKRETRAQETTSLVLPTREPTKDPNYRLKGRSRAGSGSAHSNGTDLFAPRSHNSRTRSVSPVNGYALPPINTGFGNGPLINQAGYYGRDESPDWAEDDKRFHVKSKTKRKQGFASLMLGHVLRDLVAIAVPALLWYWRLMSTG